MVSLQDLMLPEVSDACWMRFNFFKGEKPFTVMFGIWNIGNENVCFSFFLHLLKNLSRASHSWAEVKNCPIHAIKSLLSPATRFCLVYIMLCAVCTLCMFTESISFIKMFLSSILNTINLFSFIYWLLMWLDSLSVSCLFLWLFG